MASERKAIRKAAVAALAASSTPVYDSKLDLDQELQLPCRVVFGLGEDVGRDGSSFGDGGYLDGRPMELWCELYARADDGEQLADALDDLLDETELLLRADAALDALVTDLTLGNIEVELTGETGEPEGAYLVQFIMEYERNG